MIVNQFKMGSDIITYNLAGMPPLLHIEIQNIYCLSFHPGWCRVSDVSQHACEDPGFSSS